ncbi:hypothetical protein H257_14652 [Aphanomyces astaci]|uniref:Uncharacterized protein n=1 Tax=Aphanomyces astaci TaxID=112090 RepID=W4FQ80_APHAT|nr:hypothetical protein H257_14652 [Aphanomyces astaci]ETV69630.1 hypothetical protein H257_14652 [Aphanomyces astaci]|eukprot:XP_009840846.1 hypothetical protein H257_14652 [Aphanomyces astaci]
MHCCSLYEFIRVLVDPQKQQRRQATHQHPQSHRPPVVVHERNTLNGSHDGRWCHFVTNLGLRCRQQQLLHTIEMQSPVVESGSGSDVCSGVHHILATSAAPGRLR